MKYLSCYSLSVGQRGAVLVALVLSMLMVSGVSLLTQHVSMRSKLATHDEVTQTLAKAKEALISYAVTYTDNYGHNTRGGAGRLPCPSRYRHSSPSLSCGKNAIGFMPAVWNRGGKRIDIDYREFFLNQDLWYAVSEEFRYNPAYNALNPDVNKFLTVGDRDDIVAVIIHPGVEMQGQQRSVSPNDVRHYLESENADGDAVFESGLDSNDRLITISRKELMPLMERRVLGVVKEWLLEYYTQFSRMPFAARIGDPDAACEEGLLVGTVAMTRGNCSTPSLGELVSEYVPKNRLVSETWFGRYGWSAFIYYHVESACATLYNTVLECQGSLTDSHLVVNQQPVKTLLVSVGREIVSDYAGVMQNRKVKPDDASSYLDSALLLEADLIYDLSAIRNVLASNDQYVVIP